MGAHYELWPDLLHWPGSAEEGVGTHNREEPGGTLQPVKDTSVLRANQEKEAEPKESHRQHGSKATLAEVLLKTRTAAANPNGIGCTEVRGCPVSILLSASLVVFVSRHQIFPLVHPHCRAKLEEDWGLHPRGAVRQQTWAVCPYSGSELLGMEDSLLCSSAEGPDAKQKENRER